MLTRKSGGVSPNSQIGFADALYKALLCDLSKGRSPGIQKSLNRDLLTISTRLRAEGMHFVTSTLPQLGSAIYRSFDTGSIQCPSSFARPRGSALPKFLSGLLRSIYHEDGSIRSDLCIASVTEAVQVCFYCYKLEIPPSVSDEEALEAWESTEESLGKLVVICDDNLQLARRLLRELLVSFNPQNVFPEHGPGAVARNERGSNKWDFDVMSIPLSERYSWSRYYTTLPLGLEHMQVLESRAERCDCFVSRMITVPKDSRKNRIISIEQKELMYMQKGMQKALYEHIMQHPLTTGHVNFTRQGVNQALALIGSLPEYCNSDTEFSWATLDLKDASDRVSTQLVYRLFSDIRFADTGCCTCPDLYSYLSALRSDYTELPNGSLRRLHKFAPMGSAICFPVLSLVCWSICVSAIWLTHRCGKQEALSSVYVYGDDLIVRPKYVECVIQALERYGLLVNRDKSFVHGPFRESCGYHALYGHDITPIFWRKPWSQRHVPVESIAAFFEFASALYARGYCSSAAHVYQILEAQLGTKLPVVPWYEEPAYLARKSRFAKFHIPQGMARRGLVSKVRKRPLSKPNFLTPEVRCPAIRERMLPKQQWDTFSHILRNCVKGGDGSKETSQFAPLDIVIGWHPLF